MRQNLLRYLTTTPDSAARVWICLCSWLVLSGWFLSLFSILNKTGYLVLLIVFVILFFRSIKFPPFRFRRLLRRFRKPLPFLYFLTLLLAATGGALYAPTNYDGLCYRLPRILHWLTASQWHWIGSWNSRMDYSSTGFEWLMLPFLSVLQSDRFYFLINLTSFALLPGMVFLAFSSLGVSYRVAWNWMWLLPTGYCFVCQAGSIGNDSFSAVFFLAALGFGAKALRHQDFHALLIAILASGLLSGAKASNMPLLLPCAIATLPALIRFRARWPTLAVAGAFSAIISFLPGAVINARMTGDWSGDPENRYKMKLDNPSVAFIGNTMQLAVANLSPPVFPLPELWNNQIDYLLKKPPLADIKKQFPRLNLEMGELASEEGAALGAGLTMLFFVSVLVALFHGRLFEADRFGLLVATGCWAALLVYMLKMGSESAPRLIAAYYPGLLIIGLLLPGQALVVRRTWWKILAVLAALTALPLLILNPARPLFPTISLMRASFLPDALSDRIRSVYTVYRQRADNMAPVRDLIPSSAKVIGFAGTADESELSFWRPYGTRSVIDLNPQRRSTPSAFDEVDCIVGSDWGFADRFGMSAAEYAQENSGTIFAQIPLKVRSSSGERLWFIIVPTDHSKDSISGFKTQGTTIR